MCTLKPFSNYLYSHVFVSNKKLVVFNIFKLNCNHAKDFQKAETDILKFHLTKFIIKIKTS